MLKQRDQVQLELEEIIAAFQDTKDINQILEDINERLAEQIAKVVAESRNTITELLKEIMADRIR